MCILKPLFEASLLILFDAKLRLGLQCLFELMNYDYRHMHLRDRKLKTCNKLACMQTMGSGVVRALRASPFISRGREG